MFLFVNSPYSKYLTYISQMRDAENYPLQETLQNGRLKVVMETFMLSFLTLRVYRSRAQLYAIFANSLALLCFQNIRCVMARG